MDQFSGGRLIMGMASGWYKREFDAMGIPFNKRGKLMDENLEILKRLWTEKMVDGKYTAHDISAAVMYPKPAQPRIPILIGGYVDKVLQRAATAAYVAYQRSSEPPEEAESLLIIARSYADRSMWRPALDALRISLELREVADVRQQSSNELRLVAAADGTRRPGDRELCLLAVQTLQPVLVVSDDPADVRRRVEERLAVRR